MLANKKGGGMRMIRSLARRLRLSLLVGLVACLSLTHAARAQETLTVYLWRAWTQTTSGALGIWFDGVKQEFEAKYPEVKVEYQYVDFGADPILLAIAGGNPPDVTIASIAYALDLYDRGVLRSLNEYWEKSPVREYTFFPSSRIYNNRNGEVFGVPWSMEAETIVYNMDLFDQSGISTHPDALGSWDELVDAAKKLHREDASGVVRVAGFNSGLSVANFAGWLYSNGTTLYNADFTGVAFESSAGLQTLEFLSDLFNVHRVHGLGSIEAFHGGQVAMTKYQLPAGAMIANAPFPAGQTDLPPGPSGTTRSTVSWSNMFVIPAAADNPDAAWRWIEVMLSPSQQEKLTRTFGFPMSPYVEAYDTPAVEEAVERFPSIANTPRILGDAGVYPFVRYAEVSAAIQPILNQVREGRAGAQAALSEIARLMNAILGQQAVQQ